VTVDTALIPEDEAQRLKAVRRYDVLDTPPDGAFDRITALAARCFGVPIAIVSIVDSDRIWFKSHHGIDAEEIGRDPGLCASAILDGRPWVVEDAGSDPRTMANPLVAGELGLRFYAGAPLTTGDGYRLGTLCVIDHEPREFSTREAELLADMAAIVVDQLELRLEARRTVRAELSLREQAERMARDLQESLLPPDLPCVDGAEFAALYRPADAGIVGGDFYDVFEVGDTCVLAVGDVSGKGARAAAVTGLARHAIRTSSLSADGPAETLATLNRTMFLGRDDMDFEHFCTVLLIWARREQDGLSLRVARAGHPPALVRRADGSTEWLDVPGLPVGWYEDAVYEESTDRLATGDALVLFTDGVTEARTPAGMVTAEGMEACVAALRPDAGASEIVDAVRRMLQHADVNVRDDVATLAVKAR
jgi:sigma-B regulation protein RsbU (phosphoserine phosphatase)